MLASLALILIEVSYTQGKVSISTLFLRKNLRTILFLLELSNSFNFGIKRRTKEASHPTKLDMQNTLRWFIDARRSKPEDNLDISVPFL